MPVTLSSWLLKKQGIETGRKLEVQSEVGPVWKDICAIILAQLLILLPIVLGFVMAMGATIWLIMKLWGV